MCFERERRRPFTARPDRTRPRCTTTAAGRRSHATDRVAATASLSPSRASATRFLVQPAAPKRVAETPERVAKVFARAEEAAADARDVKGMDAAGADANAWSVAGSPPLAPTRTALTARKEGGSATTRRDGARPAGRSRRVAAVATTERDRSRPPTDDVSPPPPAHVSLLPAARPRRYLSPPVSPREVTAEAPLRVLVAGGGLAGLVTAAAATSKGMQVSCHTM